MTQVNIIGYIGLSELIMLIFAPFVFFRNQSLLKQHGFTLVLTFAILWIISAVITDCYRQTAFSDAIKGVATPYAIFSGIVCSHALLWDNINRFKWAVGGFVVSLVLSTYVLPYGANVGYGERMGLDGLEGARDYKLFAVTMLTAFLTFPVKAFYNKIPTFISIILLSIVAIFSLFEGGRSAFLVATLSVVVVCVAGKKVVMMKAITRYFWIICCVLLTTTFLVGRVYKYTARNGLLGEGEQKKYEEHSAARVGLLSGRLTLLSSALAIIDSPLIGHGSWPKDKNAYNLKAVELGGSDRDILILKSAYAEGRIGWISTHAYIGTAWVWNGLAGGVFWIYVFFYVFFRTFKNFMATVPEAFGYFAILLPSEFWNVWFSPLGQRVERACLITMCLLAIWVGKNKYNFPYNRLYSNRNVDAC